MQCCTCVKHMPIQKSDKNKTRQEKTKWDEVKGQGEPIKKFQCYYCCCCCFYRYSVFHFLFLFLTIVLFNFIMVFVCCIRIQVSLVHFSCHHLSGCTRHHLKNRKHNIKTLTQIKIVAMNTSRFVCNNNVSILKCSANRQCVCRC